MPIDTAISRAADEAERHAPGAPADAVVWEEVEQRTSENVELSGVFLLFMVLAALIAAVGIYLDSEILIVGAMVVGPEFGPIAGFCVALVQRRRDLARPLRRRPRGRLPAGHRGRLPRQPDLQGHRAHAERTSRPRTTRSPT